MKAACSLLISLLFADFPQSPVFSHLKAEDGLSQNTVLSIAQDSNHIMWFATLDAVDRYDGYHFKSYPIEQTRGIETKYYSDPVLFTGCDGKLYLNAADVFVFSEELDDFVPLERERSVQMLDSLSRIKTYCDSLLSSRGVSGFGRINDAVFCDDILWVATEAGGIVGVENSGRGEIVTWTSGTPGRSICSNQVRTVCNDKRGHIWAGTGNGLSVINVRDYGVVNVHHSKRHPEGLGNDMVKDIFLDDAGGVWVSTFYGGVDYYFPMTLEFSTIDTGLEEEVYGAIEEAEDGSIWIGTSRHGLCRLTPQTGKIDRFTLFENNPESDDVKAIVFSRDGRRVYVGTGLGGLTILDYITGRVISHSDGNCPRAVYSILEEDDRFIWLGTLEGLFLYDTHSGASCKVSPVEGMPLFILSLARNSENGQVWIGARSALVSCLLSVNNGIPKVSAVQIHDGLSLVQDVLCADNETWAATRKGLFRLSPTGTLTLVSGLSSNLVRSIERDMNGNIWVGTDNGLCMISNSDMRVARFFKSDGLPTDSFSLYAHELTSGGRMYFGGIGGLVSFTPQNSVPDEPSRTPFLSSVFIDGEAAGHWQNGIDLKADRKVIDLYFSVPNYSSRRKNVFHYRLKGATELWTTAGPSAQVSYSSLKPGRYSFELKSENAYGVPGDSICSVPIRVRPAWYLSAVALSFYSVIAILLVLSMIVFLTRRVASDKDKEINRLTVKHYSDFGISPEEEAFLLKVVKIIEDNISDESFSVESLASAMFMTRGNLHIKIKKATGESAIKLIHKIRFEKACTLLTSTSLPIAEIGMKVGFSSPAYFTTCFKRYTGKLPGQYRSSIQK